MICKDHVKYLKDTLESNDGYSHPELYAWNEYYIMDEFADPSRSMFKWEERYNSLRQNTQFFKNLAAIGDLVYECSNVDEFKIKIDLLNLPHEAVNFAICYMYMSSERWFLYDMNPKYVYSSELHSMQAWNIVNDMYEDISSKSLPMLEVEEFLNLKI